MADALSMLEQLVETLFGDSGLGDPDGESFTTWMPVCVPGRVSSRRDPEGRGRIQAHVPVLFEQGTPWLEPLGVGGGAANRGCFDPPRQNAAVAILFPLGRTHTGYYIPRGWRRKSEIPSGGLVDGDRTRSVREDAQWLETRDDRDSHGEWTWQHKSTGAYISIKEANEIIFDTTTGKLGAGADQAVVRGNKLADYLGSGISVGSLLFHLEQVRAAINTIAPGSLPSGAPELPGDLLSTKWKVE